MIAIDRRLFAAAAVSVIGHLGFARGLTLLPEEARPTPRPAVEVRMIDAPPPEPPPPEPEPEPGPPEPEPPRVVHEPPRARPARPVGDRAEPNDAPPSDSPVAADPTTPVFGVTMASTSSRGNAAAPVGNTTRPQPGRAKADGPVRPLGAPVAAAEVTAMPVPLGRCSGAYTEAARAAGTEGTVVLDLVVDQRGRSRDIAVVEGLEHGLTRAAVVALESCRFRPGEKDGHPVAVRLRGFKIRFFLQDGP